MHSAGGTDSILPFFDNIINDIPPVIQYLLPHTCNRRGLNDNLRKKFSS